MGKKREKQTSESSLQLGRRLKALREGRELTQEALAEKAGLSAKHLGEIERGVVNVTVRHATKIAEGLDIPVKDLLEADHEQTDEELTEAIIAMVPELNRKDAQVVYRLVKMLTNR